MANNPTAYLEVSLCYRRGRFSLQLGSTQLLDNQQQVIACQDAGKRPFPIKDKKLKAKGTQVHEVLSDLLGDLNTQLADRKSKPARKLHDLFGHGAKR